MVNFPTRIPHCNSQSPSVVDLFLYSNHGISSTTTFLPLGNSDQVFISVSIDFLSNSQRDAPFHRITYNYSCSDCMFLSCHVRISE